MSRLRVYAFALAVTPLITAIAGLAALPGTLAQAWSEALYAPDDDVQPWVRWLRGPALPQGRRHLILRTLLAALKGKRG